MKKAYLLPLEIFGIILALIWLSPFYLMLVNSFKTKKEIFSDTLKPPADFTWANYVQAFKELDFAQTFFNSLIITVGSVVVIIIFFNDLANAAPELTFATFSEFQDRDDGFPNMVENYPGIDEFEDIITANDLGLRYQGVENGEADVGVGFLTDGQLTSPEIVVLEDEKSIWPFYYPAPVVRNDVLEENPEVEDILNSVTEILDIDTIRELNGRVDVEQEDPEDVARDYLEQQGLI